MSATVIGFHHFSLLVRDLNRAAAFYEQGLGLPLKTRPDAYSRVRWYDVGGQELHLIQSESVPDRHEGHPALEVADIEAAITACLANGGTLQQNVFNRPHDNSLAAFVRDPDGNLVELTQHS